MLRHGLVGRSAYVQWGEGGLKPSIKVILHEYDGAT